MKSAVLAEILSSYVDKVMEGEDSAKVYLEMFPEYREELAPLISLSRELKEALVPVRPRARFRRELHRALLERASQRKEASVKEWLIGHRRHIMVGAAVVGSAFSLAGIIAYLLRYHIQSKEQQMAA